MRQTTSMLKKTFLGAAITATACLAMSTSAMAYDFAETCAPTTEHDTEAGTPDVIIIVDVSGSMGNDGGGGKSKIQIARESISELAQAVGRTGPCTMADKSGCDQIRLGLGKFSGSASIDVVPAEDSYAAVDTTVDGYNAGGGTYMGDAAKKLWESNELASSERAGVGVLITDGAPSSKATVEQTIHYNCAMRTRTPGTVPNYAVGFGSGADPRTNSLFAAAGGTGECCTGSSCTYQPSELFDPCDLPQRNSTQKNGDLILNSGGSLKSGYNCRGNLQADNAQALKDTLLEIAGNVACTFPLEIPDGYPAGAGADEDPEATRVEFNHAVFGPNIRVAGVDPSNPDKFYNDLVNVYGVDPTAAEPYRGEGWFFADQTRTSVRLTDRLCEEVKSDNIQVTETQVACLCENTGEVCDVPCGQDPDAGCEMNAEGEMVQSGRCQPGIVECNFGVEFCQKFYSPQPEICNGLDDNCDGTVDNLETANPEQDPDDPNDGPGREFQEWDENMSTLDARGLSEGLFCTYKSLCVCNGGKQDFGPIPNSLDNEWELILDEYEAKKDQCTCSAGLAPGEGATYGSTPDEPGADDAAACTVSALHPSAPSAGFGLLGLLGLLGLFNIRRQRRSES